MPPRHTDLTTSVRDGTSQRDRHLPALDPTSVAIDERGHADLLAFAQALAGKLRFVPADAPADAGVDDDNPATWAPFASHPDLSIADIVAYMADPRRASGERARWLGRPHFALLLAFLELLATARDQQNDLTRRHLDHYYREVLRLVPEPAVPDRVVVLLRLAARVDAAVLPAGTEFQAGRDSRGLPRIYRSERDVQISRARIDGLRAVRAERRITGIPDVRRDRAISNDDVFVRMLALSLGYPGDGEPVPPWPDGQVADQFRSLAPHLAFAHAHLYLEHHELRAMMQIVRRRGPSADREWAELNRLLGRPSPPNPRDFAANLGFMVGPLDFSTDELPLVANLDDLYDHRLDADAAAFIKTRITDHGVPDFAGMMQIKRRIDADWAEVNRLLERAGRLVRRVFTWNLETADPAAFEDNLEKALGEAWPPPWPLPTSDIASYDATIRDLEAHLSMPVERLARVLAIAEQLHEPAFTRSNPAWSELDRILLEAHREKFHADRRPQFAAARGDVGDFDSLDEVDEVEGFDRAATLALTLAADVDDHGLPKSTLPWDVARARLDQLLEPGQLALLEQYRRQLIEPGAPRRFTGADVDRVLELAQCLTRGLQEPVALVREWRNLHAHADVTALVADPAAPRWPIFGAVPVQDAAAPPTTTFGWAVRSPLLALAQGTRTITITLGLRPFDRRAFLRDLGLDLDFTPADLLAALTRALRFEVTGAAAWLVLKPVAAALASGAPDDDYWTLRGVQRPNADDRPALQITLEVPATAPAIVPLATSSDAAPTLRWTLRHNWDDDDEAWVTTLAPFEPLVLAAVHLGVDVHDLHDVQLQLEDQPLDVRKPILPFGQNPLAGARLYISHPELVRRPLDSLRFDLEWMGLPPSLAEYYAAYGISSAADFKVRVAMIDRGVDIPMIDAPLFYETPDDDALTAAPRTIAIPNVPDALAGDNPNFRDVPPPPTDAPDLRAAPRAFVWELTPRDFGHATYPALAADKARDLAIGLNNGTVTPQQSASFAVPPPYTPTFRRLRIAYRSSLELDPSSRSIGPDPAQDGPDVLLHVHPFGTSRIDPDAPLLLPDYTAAGELYIGLRDWTPPGPLALLLQLAEGTAAADREPATVEWWILDGDGWRSLAGNILHDGTRGLINSGIVELALPAVRPGTRLPADRVWLRATIARDPESVCDAVAIHPQAVTLVSQSHDRPLAPGSVQRLVAQNPRIAAILQPYSSFGGRPPEQFDRFATRVSERLRHKQRALSPWDYERLTLQRFANLHKVKCLTAIETQLRTRSTEAPPGLVEVIVVPDIRAQLPADAFAPRAPANLLADIQTYLAERAPANVTVRVRNPQYVAVAVILGVRFAPGVDERFARQRLTDDLNRFLSPWAYDEGAEVIIGGKIYANSLIDFIDRRDYVDFVAEIKLLRSLDGENFELIPPVAEDYHVATSEPDQVLVAARRHFISVVSELDLQQSLTTGIDFAKIELDFIVG